MEVEDSDLGGGYKRRFLHRDRLHSIEETIEIVGDLIQNQNRDT